jgi:biotin-[acetyl-CoA-carboxylase] ligase BirA-like protein
MIHRLRTVGSTQEVAHQLATDGAAQGTAVVAAVQTKGRGTRGRQWVSGEGGLWLTVVVRPPSPVALECLGIRVGLGLVRLLNRRLGGDDPVRLKWPNDLIARDRKLGGILCEARWQGDQLGWVAVGVGLNVANELPRVVPAPVGLLELGWTAGPGPLIEPVIGAIVSASQVGGPLNQPELDEFAERDWLRGKRVIEPVPGVVIGIAPDGRLLIERPDGSPALVVGSVIVADLAPGIPGG